MHWTWFGTDQTSFTELSIKRHWTSSLPKSEELGGREFRLDDVMEVVNQTSKSNKMKVIFYEINLRGLNLKE